MLSYQHIYHAGGPADIHKHAVLSAVLSNLRGRYRALRYMETHSGRGLYNLESAESVKTGEAAQGWLQIAKNAQALAALPQGLVKVVRDLNGGAAGPLYPGSPLIAAKMLRPADRLDLMELHPREHKALADLFAGDKRVSVRKIDGYEGVLSLTPPVPRHGLVLIDPSFEIKEEYMAAAEFIGKLSRRWPEAVIMLWYPLLAAGRHEPMLETLRAERPDMVVNEFCWSAPGAGRGMYGSGMAVSNYYGDLPQF